MALKTLSALMVLIWSLEVAVAQSLKVTSEKKKICILSGSSVDLPCSYKDPSGVAIMGWYSRWDSGAGSEDLRQNPLYSSRLEQRWDERSGCTLTITNLRQGDSAEYRFRFTDEKWYSWGEDIPGTILTVTDLQVEVTPAKVTKGQGVTLTCRTTCPLSGDPSYIWYKNGKLHKTTTEPKLKVNSNFYDSYSCAVKDQEEFYSPVVCVLGNVCSRVTYSKRKICALKGSFVDISCNYDTTFTVKSKFWFRPQQSQELYLDAEFLDRMTNYTNSGQSTMRIKNLRQSDSAEYRFRFTTEEWYSWGEDISGTILTVTDLQVEVTPAVVTEGQRVTLTCRTTCPLSGDSSYIWYKNGQSLTSFQTAFFFLDQAGLDDAGNYYCSVRNGKHKSPVLYIEVRYKPKNVTIFASSHVELVESKSVTLTCSSDANPPVIKYTWYKENHTIPESFGETYTIMNIRSEHSGRYYCEAQNEVGVANSTTYMIQSPLEKTVIVRITIVGLTLAPVLLLLVCLWLWKRKTSNLSSVEQDNLHYASIEFYRCKNQDEEQNSTVQWSQIQNQEGDVEYSVVKFLPHSAASRAQPPEDPSATYSTVNKART